jgi:hypothetical protein
MWRNGKKSTGVGQYFLVLKREVPILREGLSGALRASKRPEGIHVVSPLRFPPRVNGCPPDASEQAEAYCLDRLTAEQARAFEAHFLNCGRCAAAVWDAEDYVICLRDALAQLNESAACPALRAQAG